MSKPDPNFMAGSDEFATVRQIEYLESVRTHGSIFAASRALGRHHSTIQHSLQQLEKKEATQNRNLHLGDKVAPGFAIKGTSTLFGKDGKPAAQWVKTNRDDTQYAETMKAFALALGEDIKGLAKPVETPGHGNDELMVVIPIGDPHHGMKAWSAETGGASFDLEIAERLNKSAIDRLLQSGPDADTALILNLGDTFHSASGANTTVKGTPVDVDGRWAKVQKVGLMIMIYTIDRALQKYKKVVFRLNIGNHDGESAYGLSLMLACYYHNEPRVTIDLSPAKAWYMQFGKVLIGSSHGDTMKESDLLSIMSCDRPKAWGETSHRVWYCGHIHHSRVIEGRGGVVEYFRTLAPSDAWHSGQGYRSGRDIVMIVLHKEFGEVERHRVDVSMLEATKVPQVIELAGSL